MPSLKVLSVCSCGLTELFGADFLVNLTGDHLNAPPHSHSPSELYAARNSINNVTDLSDLTKLKILDMEKWVEFKRLESDVMVYLRKCKNIIHVRQFCPIMNDFEPLQTYSKPFTQDKARSHKEMKKR